VGVVASATVIGLSWSSPMPVTGSTLAMFLNAVYLQRTLRPKWKG
jgi:hypothetical protein